MVFRLVGHGENRLRPVKRERLHHIGQEGRRLCSRPVSGRGAGAEHPNVLFPAKERGDGSVRRICTAVQLYPVVQPEKRGTGAAGRIGAPVRASPNAPAVRPGTAHPADLWIAS